MTGPDEMLTHKTRANHFKRRIAMGGHLWLDEGTSPALVFRAHGFFQRRYELRLRLADIRSCTGWTINMKDGTTERFIVASGTGLAEALAAARSPRRRNSNISDDDGYDNLSKKQSDHLWYGDHSELNWRDREQAQAWGMDADTYVSNWLENDKD
ncbi:hypothetical protein EUA93_17110 [Nocardioides oleivorans]|uniref:Uncharacterized protein n=1 Tax=Nocardioides oleivorans TaxID=273676 RepID=A0A4Q2RVH9_9ACTN|nr:hypothetical protein [Nocardioides oleivorans]RYB91849.1 hypothetical protein EUA93_17110 [Nocardioides oleivorans]